jgi:glyoxalase family protein
MPQSLLGLHHVTAIADDPQRNIDFYTGVLGLKLVKVTVDYEDHKIYHLYYGDQEGHPGSLISFYAWPGADKGRMGAGHVNYVSFSIPLSSIGYWIARLIEKSVDYQGPSKRFNERVLSFHDPDGLAIELVAHPYVDAHATSICVSNTVPAEHAIRGLHGVTLWTDEDEETTHFITDQMGFRQVTTNIDTVRYETGEGGSGTFLDVRNVSGFWKGGVSVGTVHHVAWRTTSDEQLDDWEETLYDAGTNVTPPLDLTYYRSIFFTEPSNALFAIATDGRGFTADEPVEQLGSHLQLPSWLQFNRTRIERDLPLIHTPSTTWIGSDEDVPDDDDYMNQPIKDISHLFRTQ